MKHFHILLLVLTIFLTNSCRDVTNELSGSDKQLIQKEIVKMLDDYYSDISKEGLMAEFRYLDNSEDFFWAPPGYHTAISYDSVKTILESRSKMNLQYDFFWDALQVYPISTDIATYSGVVKGFITDSADSQSPVHMIESGTLIKRSTGWKLLSGQSSTIVTDSIL